MYFAGKRVAVIGGGDNAFESVFNLEQVTAHIDLVVRSEIRAQGWLQDKLRDSIKAGRMTLHSPASIWRFEVISEGVQLGLEPYQILNVHHVVARTGFTPANTLLDNLFPMLARVSFVDCLGNGSLTNEICCHQMRIYSRRSGVDERKV